MQRPAWVICLIHTWRQVAATLISHVFHCHTAASSCHTKYMSMCFLCRSGMLLNQCYYWQDSVTCHISWEWSSFFEEWVASKDLRPPLSPDLTPPHLLLWAYLKEQLFHKYPCTTQALKRKHHKWNQVTWQHHTKMHYQQHPMLQPDVPGGRRRACLASDVM